MTEKFDKRTAMAFLLVLDNELRKATGLTIMTNEQCRMLERELKRLDITEDMKKRFSVIEHRC